MPASWEPSGSARSSSLNGSVTANFKNVSSKIMVTFIAGDRHKSSWPLNIRLQHLKSVGDALSLRDPSRHMKGDLHHILQTV